MDKVNEVIKYTTNSYGDKYQNSAKLFVKNLTEIGKSLDALIKFSNYLPIYDRITQRILSSLNGVEKIYAIHYLEDNFIKHANYFINIRDSSHIKELLESNKEEDVTVEIEDKYYRYLYKGIHKIR